MVLIKSYFTRGSSIQIAYQCLSTIELSAKKVNSFQCKAIATKRSILDIARVSDPPLITIFGKKPLISRSNCRLVQFNGDIWTKL